MVSVWLEPATFSRAVKCSTLSITSFFLQHFMLTASKGIFRLVQFLAQLDSSFLIVAWRTRLLNDTEKSNGKVYPVMWFKWQTHVVTDEPKNDRQTIPKCTQSWLQIMPATVYMRYYIIYTDIDSGILVHGAGLTSKCNIYFTVFPRKIRTSKPHHNCLKIRT